MRNVIYKLTSPSGKVYVGQATIYERRMSKYASGQCRGQPKLYAAILKYGWDNFTKEVLESDLTGEEMDSRETFWISTLKAVSEGYNCCPVGGSPRGVRRTEEQRARQRGRKHSEETRKKLKGRKVTDETRAKISKASAGRKASEETKAKISASLKGRTYSEEVKAKYAAAALNRSEKHKKALEAHHETLRGKPLSDEHRVKLSEAHKGNNLSPEQREKIRQSVARSWTPERRAEASTRGKGRKNTPEACERIRQGRLAAAARRKNKDICGRNSDSA